MVAGIFKRGASVPVFVKNPNGTVGRVYWRVYNHSSLLEDSGVVGSKTIEKNYSVKIWLGFGANDLKRVGRRQKTIQEQWLTLAAPLCNLEMSRYSIDSVTYFDKIYTRDQAIAWLHKYNYKVPVKSGCKGCPQRSDLAW